MRKFDYWLGGLPVARRGRGDATDGPLALLRREYSKYYWAFRGPRTRMRLKAVLGWPL